jgi:threonine aldolase
VAWFSGCVPRAIPTADGILSWEQVKAQIRPLGPHAAQTGAVEIENTNNLAGGRVYPMAVVREICGQAHERGIRVHMDGARVFNAAEALGVSVAEICAPRYGDVLVSKALGAPVGSMLAGPAELREGQALRAAMADAAAGVLAARDWWR